MYTELDISFLGLKVPSVGFLLLEEPSSVMDSRHHTKLSGIIGRNLILLTYKVFMGKYVGDIFNSFECLGGVNLLLFSQLCLYHYTEILKEHNLGVSLFITRPVVTFNLPPANWLTWLKKSPGKID